MYKIFSIYVILIACEVLLYILFVSILPPYITCKGKGNQYCLLSVLARHCLHKYVWTRLRWSSLATRILMCEERDYFYEKRKIIWYNMIKWVAYNCTVPGLKRNASFGPCILSRYRFAHFAFVNITLPPRYVQSGLDFLLVRSSRYTVSLQMKLNLYMKNWF